MGAHVEVERGAAGERLVTTCIVTFVRPLARMCPSMAGKTTGVTEPLPTARVLATVRPLSRVDPNVYMKG